MKYLKQFAIIIVITFIGEALNQIIPLPIPASIYGLVIMLIALSTKILPLDKVKDVGKMLIQTMPIMFIPAGVGLITAWDKLSPIILPVVVITFISTIVVLIVSGKFTETIINKDR
ncbi:CidA/LrgA family protein [Peptostreptococcus russellii]|uniref:CidA/LrgA family protein n=1 Tax=Peptostreptococcus russellii TaxID=215200 RepID=UPI0016236D8C|nr:CidA/LrgA family protein [Peptostreptococcus russellii]MBC2578310.1 CidA/LrgA family protein [Peptostreptococcus russellii]